MGYINIEFDNFLITTDKNKMDVLAIHEFLSIYSSWADNISLEKVIISVDNSLNFGLFHKGNQVGYARVVSDYATFAYLGDVYVVDEYRGNGLSKKLMDVVMNQSELQGLRRWVLLPYTANWLYEKYGFKKISKPDFYMEKYDSAIDNKKIIKKIPK
ncbi:GNAT family acetyltransferase [Gelidibacter algens]|uniref:GNAT family N-acetyltransferase n=1 Tax=Gelidibacter algens TaxID=49280 RepID=UPI000804DE23|nr:GNAT family N-acetyltransferase [Gelidibacter algens]OBX20982.1 GNAT family acetyltransferase [Gelidibacter algens]